MYQVVRATFFMLIFCNFAITEASADSDGSYRHSDQFANCKPITINHIDLFAPGAAFGDHSEICATYAEQQCAPLGVDRSRVVDVWVHGEHSPRQFHPDIIFCCFTCNDIGVSPWGEIPMPY